jgi:hypothetical protein
MRYSLNPLPQRTASSAFRKGNLGGENMTGNFDEKLT